MEFQIEESELDDQGQALSSDGAVERFGAAQESKMDIVKSPDHEVTLDVHRVEAATRELAPMKCTSGSEPSLSTCVQLAHRVLNQSFIQDLSKHISDQAIQSYIESDSVNLLPRLSKGIGISDRVVDKETDSKTGEDSRKMKLRGRGYEEGFPEELVEKILSRVPFPFVFKARVLSKSWFFKLPVRSVRPLQPSFQNQISSMSSQWTTYCPVFFTTEEILCFDRNSHQWKSFFPLLLLSGPFDFSRVEDYCDITIAGPLVCFNDRRGRRFKSTWSVTNVITKCSRKLPDLLQKDKAVTHIRLLLVGPNLYKVLLVYLSAGETHVFNSNLQTWTVKRFEARRSTLLPNSAYLDKKLYCLLMDSDIDSVLTLWTYQVELEAWLMPTPQSFVRRETRDCAALVCGDKVMVVIWFQKSYEPCESENVHNMIGIFQLHLNTSKLTEVCRGPPRGVCEVVLDDDQYCSDMLFASDANFIFTFCMLRDHTAPDDDRDFQVISYNVHSHEWSYLPETPPHSRPYDAPFVGPFQPGLNPFISV